MERFKVEKITIPPGNMILISVFYQAILVLGDYILLGGLKLGYEVLDLSGVDAKIHRCRAEGEFILDDGHEL